MNDAGVTVICAFISPFASDREKAREIIGADRFIEAYIEASLEVCEARDPHQLYKKARSGEIENFTGISDPYEAPTAPEARVDTAKLSINECVETLTNLVVRKSSTQP
jgi:adenylylsulfate kinase